MSERNLFATLEGRDENHHRLEATKTRKVPNAT